MSGVFCILIFALLFTIVLVNTTSTGDKKATANNLVSSKLASEIPICTLYLSATTSYNRCDVSCLLTANLTQDVELAIADDDFCRSPGYHLHVHVQQVSKLRPGWFQTSAFINKISILDVLDDPQLTEIESGTFDDCTFRKMTELYIRRTQITQLKVGLFEGANSLKRLFLDQNVYMNDIEVHTLEPLFQLDEIVMMQQRQFVNLLSLTGTTQLRRLRSLSLTSNNFSSSINAETFKGCTSVNSIYLYNSSIETIGIGSFDPMAETLRFIDLSSNKLKHLPPNFLTNLKPIAITLSDNSWSCDCDSLEFQSWINNNTDIIADHPLICDTPEYGTLITDADLHICELDSTVTTPQVPFLQRLNCVNEKSESGYLYLERVYQSFSVKQLEMGKVSVEISFADSTLSMVVINDEEEASCRYEVDRQMTFDNLDPKSAHLFCLVQKTSSGTSPKNCKPFHFVDTSSIWGHNEIVIALVCSIVLALVAGFLCGWLSRCRYQRVSKANIALQCKSSTRSTSRAETSTPSTITTLDYIGAPNSKSLRRTYSDNSIVSCKSYITAVTPPSCDIIQWKLRKNAMPFIELKARDSLDKCDCFPPPLPPYPSRRHSEKIYETIREPVYTRTGEIDPYRVAYANQC